MISHYTFQSKYRKIKWHGFNYIKEVKVNRSLRPRGTKVLIWYNHVVSFWSNNVFRSPLRSVGLATSITQNVTEEGLSG